MFEYCFLNTSHRLHRHHRLLPIGIGKKITISILNLRKFVNLAKRFHEYL